MGATNNLEDRGLHAKMLAEVRRLRKVGKFPTPERDEDLTRISPEIMQEMARIILGQPPGPAWERAVKRRRRPEES